MSYHLMNTFNIASMEENFQTKKCFIEFNSKTDIGARKGWTDKPPCHNSVNSYTIL